MRVSATAEREAAFHLGFGEIPISVLSSENFDSIHRTIDFSLVQMMAKDVFADPGFFLTIVDAQILEFFT